MNPHLPHFRNTNRGIRGLGAGLPPLPSAIPTSASRCGPSARASGPCSGALANRYTACYHNLAATWRLIAHDHSFRKMSLPPRYWDTSPPYDQMPFDAIRLNVIQTVPFGTTFTVAGRLQTVLSYTVPFGFDGVLNVLINLFQPSPAADAAAQYQDGSGDLVWRVGINNYMMDNYTNITTSMGTLTNTGSLAFGGGVRIRSNQTITYFAQANANGIANLDPNGQVICGIQGWIYPNQ